MGNPFKFSFRGGKKKNFKTLIAQKKSTECVENCKNFISQTILDNDKESSKKNRKLVYGNLVDRRRPTVYIFGQ